jgi:hypothetical protein
VPRGLAPSGALACKEYCMRATRRMVWGGGTHEKIATARVAVRTWARELNRLAFLCDLLIVAVLTGALLMLL